MSTITEVPVAPSIPFRPETVTPLKPSEALRLGRLIYPNPHRGGFFDPDHSAACAVGAMLAAFGEDRLYWIRGRLPALSARWFVHCPVQSCNYYIRHLSGRNHPTLQDVIMHLNDWHDWTDQQMVSFLESMDL